MPDTIITDYFYSDESQQFTDMNVSSKDLPSPPSDWTFTGLLEGDGYLSMGQIARLALHCQVTLVIPLFLLIPVIFRYAVRDRVICKAHT